VSRVTPPDSVEPLPTLEGRAWSFGLRIDAAQILTPNCAELPASEARAHVFAEVDASIAPHIGDGDVVVAEEYGGELPLVRPALTALAAAGVAALIGRVIPAPYMVAAEETGLAVVLLDAPSFAHTGDRLRLDFDAGKVVNLSSGDRAPIRNLDEAARAQFRVALARRRPMR
jgi:hypothetical protein